MLTLIKTSSTSVFLPNCHVHFKYKTSNTNEGNCKQDLVMNIFLNNNFLKAQSSNPGDRQNFFEGTSRTLATLNPVSAMELGETI